MENYDSFVFTLKVIATAIAGLALFIYGMEHFAHEVNRFAGQRARRVIEVLTADRFRGAAVGALLTALLQSSTSVSVISLGLIDGGLLTFARSVPVIIGANVGTTVTAQLVAFKVTDWGALILAMGFLLSLLPGQARTLGKLVFYFGFVFFGLSVVSDQLLPFASDPVVSEQLRQMRSPYLFVVVGVLLTAIVQSSSVSTGLAIILIQADFIALSSGVGLIIGANAGTTITTWLASRRLDVAARRLAASHILFNLIGVLLFLPFLHPFTELLRMLPGTPEYRLALGHMIFNGITALLFLLVVKRFVLIVERLVPR